jgi:hypothetical protein
VQIAVSMIAEVPPSATINEAEPRIVAAGHAAMRAAVEAACREYEGRVVACPACQSSDLQRDGSAARQLCTSFGRVHLQLRRLRCEDCGHRFRPADPFLARLDGFAATARLRAAATLAGSSWPYHTAAMVLRELCGAHISAESVRQLTNAAGQREAQRQAEAAARLVAPTAADVRTERAAPAGAECVGTDAAPARLLVGLDGGWVPSRDQPGGMEGKVGVVATEVQPVGRRGRQRLVRRRYVATFGDADRLGALAYAAAHGLGGEHAARQTALGDGADWIKAQAALHFPTATTILDWPHLARVVHRAIRAARPGHANQEVRRRASALIPALRWDRAVEAAATELADLPPAGAEPVAAVEAALTSLTTQRDWLGDYGAWRDAGEPIGSGMVEREIALVINRRMKRQGMRWRRTNADALVALRVRTINDSWHQHVA